MPCAVGKHLFWTTAFWEETWTEILIYGLAAYVMGFPGGSDSKEITCNAEDLGVSPGWEDPLGEGTATHFNIFAWRIMDRGAWQATYSP